MRVALGKPTAMFAVLKDGAREVSIPLLCEDADLAQQVQHEAQCNGHTASVLPVTVLIQAAPGPVPESQL